MSEHPTPDEPTDGIVSGGVRSNNAGSEAETSFLPRSSEEEPVLSVVLPTLDEESGIVECLDRIEMVVEEFDVPTEVIVSDSSTDRTAEIANERGAIVVKPDRPGYGYAYRYAFEHLRGRYIAIGDADCTYDFTELPKLLRIVAAGDADMVMGSRLAGEVKPGSMPPLHHFIGNPLLTALLNAFYRTEITDAHSGFRVIRRDSIERMDLHADGMEFASEMIMEATAKGLTIEEVPITYHERRGEPTLDSYRDGWRHIKYMITNAPGRAFSLPGLALGAFGVFTMVSSLVRRSSSDTLVSTATGSMLTVIGFQAFVLGVFATVAGNPIRRPEDRLTRWASRHTTTERGTKIGTGLVGMGGAHLLSTLLRRDSDGSGERFVSESTILSITAIVIGIETVFCSFFLYMIDSNRRASGDIGTNDSN